MKIAVVGTGIAGNFAANRLARDHDVTVFEADSRIGGHTNTVDVVYGGQHYAVDTGFIVFNDWTYPNFIKLLDELDVASQPSDMSFSVSCARSGLEYNGASLNALFAQRSNLFKPVFYRMLLDILRFNREAPALLEQADNGAENGPTLGEFLHANGYSDGFIRYYIVPMGAAIWSATHEDMRSVPAEFFVRFFLNHGLLSVNDRPTWRVVKGGSRQYVSRLVAGHRDRIRLSTPVQWIRRNHHGVELKARGCDSEHFDKVFLACHSDQALDLLADPSDAEVDVLGSIRYQNNQAVLHTDATVLPHRRRAWAAWNYHVPHRQDQADGRVRLSYNMNILQGLDAPVEFCVTLNNSDAIDPEQIIQAVDYAHPVFTTDVIKAQARHREINGVEKLYYCGAYWRYGFHEDGVVSAMTALEHFEQDLADHGDSRHEKPHLSRAS